MIPADSPFHPDNEAGYQAWRAAKLAGYPSRGEELIIPVKDPRNLSDQEYQAIWRLIAKTNMAIYATDLGARTRKVPACFPPSSASAIWTPTGSPTRTASPA